METLIFEEAAPANGNGKPHKTMTPQLAGSSDHFQTPPEVVEMLTPFLPPGSVVWEPACGKGNLVRGFRERGYQAFGTDILTGQDFLTWGPDRHFTHVVTNPPYGKGQVCADLKEAFLARCYSLRRPFAILMPITALEGQGRQRLYREYGLQLIIPPRRIAFETPNGRAGKDSSPWFPSCWFTWGLELPRDLLFWEGVAEESSQPSLFAPTPPPGDPR